MIDLDREELLGLAEAARCVPKVGGRRAHTSTIFRWCTRGLNGVRLEHVRVGRRIATTRGALTRFFNRLALDTPAAPAAPAEPLRRVDSPTTRDSAPAARAHAIREAEDRLRAAGL